MSRTALVARENRQEDERLVRHGERVRHATRNGDEHTGSHGFIEAADTCVAHTPQHVNELVAVGMRVLLERLVDLEQGCVAARGATQGARLEGRPADGVLPCVIRQVKAHRLGVDRVDRWWGRRLLRLDRLRRRRRGRERHLHVDRRGAAGGQFPLEADIALLVETEAIRTGWQPFDTPQKAATSVLFYNAVAGQTDFILTTPDMFANISDPLLADGSQGIEVWLNGARLTPSKGPTVVDFTVNVATSTVSLLEATQAGAILAVDVLTPASAFAPSQVALVKIKIVPDGTTTTFPLIDASNNPYHSNNAAQFIVAVDGIPQNPGVDYTMSGDGNSIVFTTAPAADSTAFAVIAY